MTEARTPSDWKRFSLYEADGGYEVALAITRNPVTPEILKAAGIPESTRVIGLSRVEALALGDRLETWYHGQKPQKPSKTKAK